MKNINKKIVEINDCLEKLERLKEGLLIEGGVTGQTGYYTGVSTLVFLHITLETTHEFMPSLLNEKYEFRVAQNIALPIIENEIKKLKQDRKNLTGGWFKRNFKKMNY